MLTYNKVLSFASGIAMLAMLVGFSSTTQAQSNGKSVKMPYGMTVNFCNNEMIETTGDINLVYTTTEDENGCIKVKYHFNTQNVRGVGMTTGDEYRIIEVRNQKVEDVTVCGGCTVEIKLSNILKVKSKDGDSFNSHVNAVLSLNFCTGEFIVVRQSGSSSCE